MNCEQCQLQLEDFLYGELEPTATAKITEHLSVCVDCRRFRAAVEQENEIFARYYEQNALDVTDEMWSSIRAQIAEAPINDQAGKPNWLTGIRGFFSSRWSPVLVRQVGFAAALILVSVGLTTLYFSMRQNNGTQTAQNTAPTATPTTLPMPSASVDETSVKPKASESSQVKSIPPKNEPRQLASVKLPISSKTDIHREIPEKLSEEEMLSRQIGKATREYQGAIKLLERAVAKRKTELDDATVKQFEGSLALIDASIVSSRQALREHPTDPTAARFLLAAYSKKVELMQEIAMR